MLHSALPLKNANLNQEIILKFPHPEIKTASKSRARLFCTFQICAAAVALMATSKEKPPLPTATPTFGPISTPLRNKRYLSVRCQASNEDNCTNLFLLGAEYRVTDSGSPSGAEYLVDESEKTQPNWFVYWPALAAKILDKSDTSGVGNVLVSPDAIKLAEKNISVFSGNTFLAGTPTSVGTALLGNLQWQILEKPQSETKLFTELCWPAEKQSKETVFLV